MIVDTLTHVWESPGQLGGCVLPQGPRDPRTDKPISADPVNHFECQGPVNVSMVLAFTSDLLEAHVPNRLVAEYVRSHPDRLIGIASIDPTRADALEELELAVSTLGLKGVAVSPAGQGFHPMNTRAQEIYQRVVQLDLPLIIYQGPAPAPQARLEFAEPMLLDELLRDFPDLRVILGGLGSPWIHQTLTLMSKHPNLLANMRGIIRGPWQTYNALLTAQEFGVIDRLLFASDFPYTTPATCIEMLYSLHQIVKGTNLPAIPREMLRGIVERDTLRLLRLETPGGGRGESPSPADSPAVQTEIGS
ncbi:MAG: hypothetical protein BIFFINMI_01838 [Phycisphaerae bacterium]|nr:hypothetical protein [Phycisphaerae bacterium]